MLVIITTSTYSTLTKSHFARAFGPAAANMLIRLAMPQLTAAFVILTCSHVQIITRLSSGYPMIYLWLATQFVGATDSTNSEDRKWSKGTIRWMVMYAMIQGGLFASFLPPA